LEGAKGADASPIFLYGGKEGQIKNGNVVNDSLNGKKRGKI